jgi:hypothetical protein
MTKLLVNVWFIVVYSDFIKDSGVEFIRHIRFHNSLQLQIYTDFVMDSKKVNIIKQIDMSWLAVTEMY